MARWSVKFPCRTCANRLKRPRIFRLPKRATCHEAAGYFPAHAADYSEEVRQRLEAGGKVPAMKYLAGLDVRKRMLAEFDAAFQDVDAIVAPTVPIPAPPIGAESVADRWRTNRRAPRAGGDESARRISPDYPAISVPCGFTRDGLPIGLQLIGRAFDETTLLRIAYSYERAHDWGARHPSFRKH